MTDPPRYSDSTPPATPKWVKVFGIIALIVVVLFVVLLFTPGRHGPGRHMGRGNTAPVEQTAQPHP